MQEEEDDFYGGGDAGQDERSDEGDDEQATKEDRMDTSDGEEEESDSDDDIQITLEKPDGAKPTPPPGAKPHNRKLDRTVSSEITRPAKSGTPVRIERPRSGSPAPPTAVKGTLTHNGKEGKDFPEIRTSNVDVNATPTWPGNGKPIIEVDIDADLAELSKPWRLPGTDLTDFFNYGFDEYTWTQYCVRQQMMAGTINEQKNADAQMKALFGGGAPGGGMPGGGMPGMPPGMPPGMAMPDPDQLMQMVNQGVIPPEFAQQMMQQMGGGGGGGMGPFPGAGFGSGQNSVSPQPQAGQGFQPPSGPSGGNQGQQGGFPPGNIEGYSPQQLAIMQQEQQGQMQGGSGGRGRNRRGRGFY